MLAATVGIFFLFVPKVINFCLGTSIPSILCLTHAALYLASNCHWGKRVRGNVKKCHISGT